MRQGKFGAAILTEFASRSHTTTGRAGNIWWRARSAKTRDGGEAYHVLVGGGFGNNAACGRQIFKALPVEELNSTVEKMLQAYLKHRAAEESFQDFTIRHDLNSLQVLFSDEQ